jgi:hypothetical protein
MSPTTAPSKSPSKYPSKSPTMSPSLPFGTVWAWADNAICHIDLNGVNNWGFSIPLPSNIPSAGITYDLISGAGGCKLSSGRCDGKVTMFQEGDDSFRFEVKGNTLNSVLFHVVHVYIGADPLPKTGGKNPSYSNVVGQFPCAMDLDGVSTFSVNCAALRRKRDAKWLAFHLGSSGTTTAAGQAQCSF